MDQLRIPVSIIWIKIGIDTLFQTECGISSHDDSNRVLLIRLIFRLADRAKYKKKGIDGMTTYAPSNHTCYDGCSGCYPCINVEDIGFYLYKPSDNDPSIFIRDRQISDIFIGYKGRRLSGPVSHIFSSESFDDSRTKRLAGSHEIIPGNIRDNKETREISLFVSLK